MVIYATDKHKQNTSDRFQRQYITASPDVLCWDHELAQGILTKPKASIKTMFNTA
jgi:hypothetical protein